MALRTGIRTASTSRVSARSNRPGSLPARLTGCRPLATAPTWPAPEPTKQLDLILADGPVRALGGGVARDTGLSDHRALWVDVTLS